MVFVCKLHHRSAELRKVFLDQICKLVTCKNCLLLQDAHISPCIDDLCLYIPISSVAEQISIIMEETRRTYNLPVTCTVHINHLRRLGTYKHDKTVLLALSHKRQTRKKRKQYD